jgi:hypothetical protein
MCGLGFQSSMGQLSCSPCPAGFTCPSTSDPSLNIPCSPGFYSAEGDVNCNACMAGNYCPNTTMAEEFSCPKGTYSKAAAVSCSPCPLGWKCPFTDGHGNTECALVSFQNQWRVYWYNLFSSREHIQLTIRQSVFRVHLVHTVQAQPQLRLLVLMELTLQEGML